ncbi:MAG TPA: dTDP-4-dehydrorhamnose reductase [Caldilineae bacterium]|nr:dTDP-4-dehydrorhamnose reductase [Caldilineae bacterium]
MDLPERIVVTGARGQLGRALCALLTDVTLLAIDLEEADIRDGDQIIPLITEFRPDVVIHAAAWTDVDGAERDPDGAYAVNALGTQNVALACQQVGAAMLYVSTNEVFDGRAEEPYREWDAPAPISVYARSKWAGEQIARMLLNRLYIVRTAWVFAPGGNNFPSKIIAAADRHGALRVVDDEIGNPTYAPDLARAIVRLISTGRFGIYHLTNEGACSRYEWACEILRMSGREHVPVTPIPSSEWKRLATPPLRAVLANTAAAALGIRLRPWREALKAYFEESEPPRG